jgi:hypothetical protein
MQVVTFGKSVLAESPPTVMKNDQSSIVSDDRADIGDIRKATKRYRGIGNGQIFAAADGSVWLFCDIEDFTHRRGYAEPPVVTELTEFVALRVTPDGEVIRWSMQGDTLTAHSMAVMFFSKGGEVYGIKYTGEVFRFAHNGDPAGTVVSIEPTDIGFSDLRGKLGGPNSRDGWSDQIAEVNRVNRNESFTELYAIGFGLQNPPAEIFGNHKLSLAIRFENKDSVPDRLGWQRAIAYSLDQKKPWQKVLIDVK